MTATNKQYTWKDGVSTKCYFEKLMDALTKANDQRIEDLEEKIMTIFESQKTALNKSEQKMDLRLEGMNEFRQAMADQSKNFLHRDEFEAKHQILEIKIEAMQKMVNMALGALLLLEFVFKYLLR
jgi:hypothetical protein